MLEESGVSVFGLKPDQAVVVYGLGASGVAVVVALARAGVRVWAWDDANPNLPEEIEAEVVRPEAMEWRQVQLLVKAPGIAATAALVQAAMAAGVPVRGELDLLWRRERDSGAVWLGITGTNGKSTVTALVAHVLQSAGHVAVAGGNLGTAGLALPGVGQGGFYVLELSSYMLEMQEELRLDGAVWLNLTPDHLARHGSMANYYAAKARIFAHTRPEGVRVVGDAGLRDGPHGSLAAQGVMGEVVVAHAHDVLRPDWPAFANLPGPHNAQNIACAYRLLVPRWMDEAAFVRGVESFVNLPHRLEQVGRLAGVAFVNDSKATNGDSAVPALRSFANIYWLCGGQAKTDGLGATLGALEHVRAAFTLGESGPAFAAALRSQLVPTEDCGTLEVAVRAAFALARKENLPGATVLLSPAAASWDQFKSFAQRGDTFKAVVAELAKELEQDLAREAGA